MKVFFITKRTKTLLFYNKLLVLTLFLALALRVYFAFMPDRMGDVSVYLAWCQRIVKIGINASYFGDFEYPIDYPPIFPYILGLVGTLYNKFDFSLLERWGDSLSFMIRFPAITADILTSLLIFLLIKKQINFKIAYLVMLTYTFNPAIIFNTAYWGQSDAIHSLFVLLSIVCLIYKKPELSWGLITLGIFTKPLALSFIPLIFFLSLKNYRWRRLLGFIFISLIVSLIILSPFIYHHTLRNYIIRMIHDLEAMPYISVNAHNIWWLISFGPPWIPAANRLFNLFTFKAIGIFLFGLFYFYVLFKLWKFKNSELIYLFSVAIGFALFMLSPCMHENHMFTLFPLLVMIYFRDKRLGWLYAFLSMTFLANMFLHDPYIITRYLYKVPYDIKWLYMFTYAPEKHMSSIHRGLTLFNSLVNTILFGYLIVYLSNKNLLKKSYLLPPKIENEGQ